MILFELLTGHVPFDAESAVSIALKHVSEAPPAPSMFDPSVPPALEAIVLWALEKDPAQRPADADAFILALEDARDAVLAERGARPAHGDVRAGGDPARAVAEEPLRPPRSAGAAADPTPIAYYADPTHEHERAQPPAVVGVAARARSRWRRSCSAIVLLTRPGNGHGAAGRRAGRAVGDGRAARRRASKTERRARRRAADRRTRCSRRTPAGGGRRDEGSTVTLTVSRGPGRGGRSRRSTGSGEQKASAQLDERRPRGRPRRAAGRRQRARRARDPQLAGGRHDRRQAARA